MEEQEQRGLLPVSRLELQPTAVEKNDFNREQKITLQLAIYDLI